jgi:hypothetical protein
MRVLVRGQQKQWNQMRTDLLRPHEFAAERVGFISVKATLAYESLVLLIQDYQPVADRDYVYDPSVGAMIGSEGLRHALETALLSPVGIFHVHLHHHLGSPRFSRTDLSEYRNFVPDFFKVRPSMPHGAILLSLNDVCGLCWTSKRGVHPIDEFHSVDATNHLWRAKPSGTDVLA